MSLIPIVQAMLSLGSDDRVRKWSRKLFIIKLFNDHDRLRKAALNKSLTYELVDNKSRHANESISNIKTRDFCECFH